MVPVQTRFLEKAVAFYEKFAHGQPGDTAGRVDLARSRFRVGEIRKALGQLDQAEEAHRIALGERLAFSQAYPDRADLRADAAESVQALARILIERGNLRDAETEIRRAIALAESAVSQEPSSVAGRRRLGSCLSTLGVVMNRLKRLPESEAALRRSIGLYEGLVGAGAYDVEMRLKLAETVLLLAAPLSQDSRNVGETETVLRRGLELIDALAAENPGQRVTRAIEAQAHYNLGTTLRTSGRRKQAEPEIRTAAELYTRLVEDFPQVESFRGSLVLAHRLLGDLYTDLRRLDDAEAAFRKCIEQGEELTRQFPAQPSHRQRLGKAHLTLGTCLARDRLRPADGADETRRGIEIFGRLAHDYPDTPVYQEELGSGLGILGILLRQARKFDEAEAALRRAVQIQRRLSRDLPATPSHEKILANSLLQLADLFKDTRRLDEAGPFYLDALEINRKLVERQPASAQFRQSLGGALNNYGIYLGDRDDQEGEIRVIEEAIENQTLAVRSDPTNRVAQQFLRNHYQNLASAFEVLKQPERVVAAVERMARALPKSAAALAYAAEDCDGAAKLIADDMQRTEPEREACIALVLERARMLIAASEKAGADEPEALRLLVKTLAAADNEQLRDLARAQLLARRCTELAPQESDSWTMLALACARSGDWAGARDSVVKALACRPGGDDRDYLLSALALHHLGQADAALRASADARQWAKSNRVTDRRLVGQLRAEAVDLLGVNDPPADEGKPQKAGAEPN